MGAVALQRASCPGKTEATQGSRGVLSTGLWAQPSTRDARQGDTSATRPDMCCLGPPTRSFKQRKFVLSRSGSQTSEGNVPAGPYSLQRLQGKITPASGSS